MTREEINAWLERVLKKLSEPIYCAVTAAELVQVMIDELSTKKTATDLFDGSIDSAPEQGYAKQSDIEFIMTSNNKMFSGPDLERFRIFWKAFDHKSVSSRAAAATAWLKIKDTKDTAFMAHIVAAACAEAKERGKRPATPKMAQGWLTDRRWEQYNIQNALPKEWNKEYWERFLTPHLRRTRTWPEFMPGPNPWDQLNLEIPQEVRDIYAEPWGWK